MGGDSYKLLILGSGGVWCGKCIMAGENLKMDFGW